MQVMELFRRRSSIPEVEYDQYEAVMGSKLDVESLLHMRDLEDFWIELGHMTEEERYPVPEYLSEEWTATVGVGEANRVRSQDE